MKTSVTARLLIFAILAPGPARAAQFASPIILAQVPSQVKTGFQYGPGLLFMIGFPKLHAHYNEMTKEFLARKMMLSCMRRSEVGNERDQELVEWSNQNPEIKARVEDRIHRVSPDRCKRAFIVAAREEMQTHLLRQGAASAGMRP
jgi:hypothetical protein